MKNLPLAKTQNFTVQEKEELSGKTRDKRVWSFDFENEKTNWTQWEMEESPSSRLQIEIKSFNDRK